MVEKAKLSGQKTNQWLVDSWKGGEVGYKGHRGNFGDNGTILYIEFNGGYTFVRICQTLRHVY